MKPIIVILLISMVSFAKANDTIYYEVSFPNALHHEAQIQISFESQSAEHEIIQMSRTSPGRYALHDFVKNVYEFKAISEFNHPLMVTQDNPNSWNIENPTKNTKIEYTLWGNHPDGTYVGINHKFALLNAPAAFAYVKGRKNHPIKIKFEVNPDWSIATQLPKLGKNTYYAPDLDYFMDSPVLIGDIETREWKLSDSNNAPFIRLSLIAAAEKYLVDQYVDWMKQIITEQKNIYGEFPNFDFNGYTFLAIYDPLAYGDGMEHRNSTILTSPYSLQIAARGLIGTVAHEFFHIWNVERLRPASLQPFDYQEVNMSDALWFAEGFTSYYDDLTLCRTQIINPADYLKRLNNALNEVLHSPARKYYGPVGMSQKAPFVDAAAYVDKTNLENTYLSYYTYGAVIGLALDLTLRQKFDTTLDDYMRTLWVKYGRDEIPYQLDDLQQALADLTNQDFSSNFFKNYIYGSEMPDFANLFSSLGIVFQKKFPGNAMIAFKILPVTEQGAKISHLVLHDSPLFKANLTKGDVITRIENSFIDNRITLDSLIDARKPGDTINITFQRNGTELQSKLVLQEVPTIELSFDKSADERKLSKRNQWLNTRAITE